MRNLVRTNNQGRREHADTSTENKNTPAPFFATVAIALLLLTSIVALLLVRKKRLADEKKTATNGTDNDQPDNKISARTIKQQLLSLLEEAGIKSPGGMTRMELLNELQKINIPDETRSDLPVVLDSLDKILYSSAEEKEGRIPDRIAVKVKALLNALK